MNLPNKLTVTRCILAMVFVGLMSFESVVTYILAYVTFIAASVTDYYDGKIARQRNLITDFGKLIDPVADKVLMVAAFVMLMKIPALRIPGWAIVMILAREFLVTGARSLAATGGAVISASQWGKIKTLCQMIYVFTFLFLAIFLQALEDYAVIRDLLPGHLEWYVTGIGIASMVSIVLVSLYTVCSGIEFAWSNWKALKLGQSL